MRFVDLLTRETHPSGRGLPCSSRCSLCAGACCTCVGAAAGAGAGATGATGTGTGAEAGAGGGGGGAARGATASSSSPKSSSSSSWSGILYRCTRTLGHVGRERERSKRGERLWLRQPDLAPTHPLVHRGYRGLQLHYCDHLPDSGHSNRARHSRLETRISLPTTACNLDLCTASQDPDRHRSKAVHMLPTSRNGSRPLNGSVASLSFASTSPLPEVAQLNPIPHSGYSRLGPSSSSTGGSASISTGSASSTGGGFKTWLRRLGRWPQLDFELAVWQMGYLCIAPRRVQVPFFVPCVPEKGTPSC